MNWLRLTIALFASAASASNGVGPFPEGVHQYVWRVGSSPNADGSSIVYDIRNYGAAATQLSAMLWKTGAQHAAGQWTATLSQGGTPIASSTLALTPDSWNTWSLASPVPLDAGATLSLELRSTGSAESDFINVGSSYSAVTGQTGDPYSRDDVEASVRLSTGPTTLLNGTFVVVLSGVDPFAVPACTGSDRQRVSGWPYDTIDPIFIPDGAAAVQSARFVVPSAFGPQSAIGSIKLPLQNATATQIWVDLSASGVTPTSTPLDPNYDSTWDGTFPVAFLPPTLMSGAEFQITVRPVGGSVIWPRLSSSLPQASACDPIARAGWLGVTARAGNRLDADFMFAYDPCFPELIWRDADGDGFGDPASPLPTCNFLPRPGFVRNAGDCDDTDPDKHPGAKEICDGTDDDCDGLVDAEDLKLVLEVCERDVGICAGAHHLRSSCSAGAWRACEATSYGNSFEPVELSCDGRDNDCDGQTDEVSAGPLCGNQQGVCAGSHAHTCSDASWSCGPDDFPSAWEGTESRCDGLDNDCDGVIDGADPDVQPTRCELQKGVCANAMHSAEQCSVWGWQPCDVRQYGDAFQPTEELCDGLDNDCDGEIDEGCVPQQSCAAAGGLWFVMAVPVLLALMRRRRLALLTVTVMGCTSPTPRAPERGASGFHVSGDETLSASGRMLSVSITRDGEVSLKPGSRAVSAGPLALQTNLGPGHAELHDGHVSIVRGQIVEELEMLRDGLEQRWRIPARPEGDEDFIITIGIEGQDRVALTPEGARFSNSRAGLGLQYGPATLVDRINGRWKLAYQLNGARLEIRVPSQLLDTAVYPLTIDPLISVEEGLDAPVYQVALSAIGPKAAFDGTNYLLVWDDRRLSYSNHADIYAERVSQSGAILEPAGIAIASSIASEEMPEVAWGGGQYLIAWIRNSGATSDVYAARVSSSGTLLDPSGIPVTQGSTVGQYSPAVAYGAGEFLIVWQHDLYSGQADIYGARVSSTGAVLDTTPLIIAGTAAQESAPRVAGNASGFAVTWEVLGGPTARAGRVLGDGTLLDATGIKLSSTPRQDEVFVAGDGTDFLAVWLELPTGNYNRAEVHGTRITWDGGIKDPTGIAVVVGDGERFNPVLAFNGTEYVATWWQYVNDAPSVAETRIELDGGVLDNPAKPIASVYPGDLSWPPGLACSPSQCLEAWPFTSAPATAARWTTAGTVLDPTPFPFVLVRNSESKPDVVSNGSAFLVAWVDNRAKGINAVRVDETGTVLDAPAITLSTGGAYPDDWVSLASNGVDYLATWVSSVGVMAARISADGGVLDSPPLLVTNGGAQLPRAAANGSEYLVTWMNQSSSPFAYGARITFDGRLLDPGGNKLYGLPADDVRVASDGVNFIVTFTDLYQATLAVRVDSDGNVLDMPARHLFQGGSPQFAFDGTNWLAVTGSLNAVRISPSLTVLDASPFGLGGGLPGWGHCLSHDGLHFLVASFGYLPNYNEVLVARASAQGQALGQVTIDTTGRTSNPAIASTRNHISLVVYQRGEVGDVGQPARVIARLFNENPAPAGTSCQLSGDCLSGFCVDGVCCNEACGGGVGDDCQACSVAAGAPSDGVCSVLGAGYACRNAADVCDFAERCDGLSRLCPPDGLVDAGVLCRGAERQCDDPEYCTGTTPFCPDDAKSPSGTPCDDHNDCSAPDTCDGFGDCGSGALDAGTPCDDHNACTSESVCDGFLSCQGVKQMECPAPDECHAAGYCDPETAACFNAALPDGSHCSGGTCLHGSCAAMPDAGAVDAGVTDAGIPDAGSIDSGTTDAGSSIVDAGEAEMDGGHDAGATPGDAGVDAGAEEADGGMTKPMPRGCGCETAPGSALWLLFFVFGNRARRVLRELLENVAG